MTNLKKLGLSALAGSLVAVSAQAGEIAVSGSANVTVTSGETYNSQRSIGTDKDVAFSGSGELDNGWTFSVSTLLTDKMSVSSSYTSLTMGSLGTLTAGTDFGGAHYKYDEEVPQAYEQTSDASQNSANIVGNIMDNNAIVYASPSFDMGGVDVSFDVEYAFGAGDSSVAIGDGGQQAYNETFGTAIGGGITAKYMGAQFGIYANERENNTPQPAGDKKIRDSFEGVAYIKYSYGPVSVGYSQSYLDSGVVTAESTTTAVKVVRTASGIFEMESMSVAFNVNDNLSISYTSTEDVYDMQDDQGTSASLVDVSKDTNALQIAYSMGAMSVKAYQMETDNPGYDDDADDLKVTEIALGLAF
jgi:outer membrane protein OmpU